MRRKFKNLSLVASLIFATLFLTNCEKEKDKDETPENTISDVRALEDTDALTQDWAIKGIVVSNNSTEDGNNMGSKKNLIIQDSKDVKSGLMIRMMEDHSFLLGEEIEIKIKGNKLTNFQGTIQIGSNDDATITKVAEADRAKVDALLQTITVDQLNTTDYQSMYIAIADAQIKSENFGKKFNGNVNASAASKDFVLRTGQYAVWASTIVPEDKGILKGIGGIFQFDASADITYNVQPQRTTDWAGLGEPGTEIVPPPVDALFLETFGTVTKTTQFAAFNTANGFSKTGQPDAVYSANTRISIRNSSSSLDAYEGASGEGNVWFSTITDDPTNFLTMDKLTIAYASILTFGFNNNANYDGTATVDDMVVSYRIGDAGDWVVLTKTSATPSSEVPWVVVTCAEMPTGVTAIKFATTVDEMRLDDVMIKAKQ